MNRRLTLLLLVLSALSSLGQSGFRMTRYDVSRGLSQNTVNAIVEDHQGFIWMATQDGLNRFDGERFLPWPSEAHQGELNDSFVTALAESPAGYLYIGTRDGVNRIDPERSLTQRISCREAAASSFHNTVDQIGVVNDQIFIRQGQSLYRIDDTDSTATELGRFSVRSIAAAKSHLFAIDQEHRLCIYDAVKLPQLQPIELVTEFKPTSVFSSGDAIFLSGEGAFARLNPSFTSIDQTWQIPHAVNAVYLDETRLFVATERGLYSLESNTSPERIKLLSNECSGLERDYIRCFASDRYGGVWVGSNRFGAFRHDGRARYILHFPGNLFADPVIWAAAMADTLLLVGSTSGLDYFSCLPTLHSPTFNPENQLVHRQRISDLHVSSILIRKHQAWVATRANGVRCYNLTNDGLSEQVDAHIQVEGSVYHLAEDHNNNLLVCTSKGLIIRTPSGELKSWRLSAHTNFPVADYAHHLLVDRDNIWFSTMTGLHRYDFTHQTLDINGPIDPNSELDAPFIASATQLSDGTVWLASLGAGIRVIDPERQKLLHRASTQDGLSNDVVYGIVEMNSGVLACTNNGLSLLSNDAIIRANYNSVVGLPFDEHSQNAFGSLNGVPWFGGIDGFYFVLPQAFDAVVEVPDPVITELRVNFERSEFSKQVQRTPSLTNKEGRHQQGGIDHRVDLFPGDNALTIGVALPGIVARDYRIRYRMAGVVNEWITLRSNEERIHFTTLPGGAHTLEISAIHRNGTQDSRINVGLFVHPPFWERLWFIAAIAVILVAVTFVMVRAAGRRRLRSEILKRQAIERVKQERERISMDLHDNIGSHITHVITSLDNLSYRAASLRPQETAQRLDALSDFARGAMQQLRDTIWTLSREEITVNDFVARINDYFSHVFQDLESPLYTIDCAEKSLVKIPPETAVQTFRVIQECLSNALKHANATRIRVEVNTQQERLYVHFSDDGQGFTPVGEGSPGGHFGLSNMKRRVERLNGSFSLESKIGEGTVIAFHLPLPL